MNPYNKVTEGIQWVLDNRTSYEVAKDLGIQNRTINRYQNGTSPIDNMTLGTAEKIYNYYLKEMARMGKWEFEGYTVHEETDLLRFEDEKGEVLGYVMKDNDVVADLNNGADPIADGWEDGIGNTISIDGWGSDE